MSPEIAHPITLAAENLERTDPELIAHWRDELAVAPTRERARQAVYALAGLGSVVEVRLEEIEEVDGVWCAGGTLRHGDHQFVVWVLSSSDLQYIPELRAAMDSGAEPIVFVPPALFLPVPPGAAS